MGIRRFGVVTVCALAWGGCAVGPDYENPVTTAPAEWSGIESGGPASQPAWATTQPARPTTRPADVAEWWKSLDDPVLDSLVLRAVQSNLDLRIATARVREARALRGFIAADLWPQITAAGSYDYRGSSLNTGPKVEGEPGPLEQARDAAVSTAVRSFASGQGISPSDVATSAANQLITNAVNSRLPDNGAKASRDQNLFQAGFDATWEVDVFGGIRRAVEAADADIAAIEEGRRDVLVTLISEVALNYVQLRGAQRRLAIAYENIDAQSESLELTQLRLQGGFANELDVTEAQAQLATTESQVPLLRSAIRQAIYQLSVLLAMSPATLVPELEKQEPIPSIPPEVPVGLPSELLRRRPDVRAAERQLAAATARIGEATADLFPRFSLTGSFGSQSRDVRHMLDRDSLTWSVGPTMSWPVLDGWRIRSNIEVQNARQEQALALYERTVLIAFQEVEQALVSYQNEQVRRESLIRAVTASRQSTELSNLLYARGWTDFLNVLVAQRTLYASQDELALSDTTVVTNLIALYKALGGGWEAASKPQENLD